MELAQALTAGLDRLLAAGRVAVRENGAPLAVLEGFEVRQPRDLVLLHLWSRERNAVRRVLRVLADEPGRLAVETARFGRARPGRLEFIAKDTRRPLRHAARAQFFVRFRELLAQGFPDEKLASLTASADLRHSLSGNYARRVLQASSRAWAVLGAAPGESAATYDAMLTFGLLWLDRARVTAQRKTVAGLRLFFPTGTGRITAHRVQALAPAVAVELYEYSQETWRSRQVDPRDTGNVDTWLVPRRQIEAALAEAGTALHRIRRLAPGAIEAQLTPGTCEPSTPEIVLRFHGLPFARWSRDDICYGLEDPQQPLTPDRQADFERLVRGLETHRSATSSATRHPLYRAQPERWLQSLVATDPARVDARLDPRFLYAQVPALAGQDRSVIDLLGLTRSGRLAVLELKAGEDLQLLLQAMDYWLRVRWHHAQQDFSSYGYFPGATLDPRPPLLFLVAPAIRFHPATDTLLRYLSSEIEVCRVGVGENWRRGLRVVLRQTKR